MRFSALFVPTLRETPAEAEIPSHQLMLRAGLMRQTAGGIYTFLPLAQRVLTKISRIIREEMDRVGCQELLMPILQPADLWHRTGRWADYGDEMFRLEDRYGRSFCLGPTHEEIVTDLVQKEVRSYKQLPLILYQIQNKYRDEIRPRFGVMRGREFIMKDAYSFDTDSDGLQRSYETMFDVYKRIFERCGLKTKAVMADAGAIGGDYNHEFVVPAETGEDEVAFCTRCDFAANLENAPIRAVEKVQPTYTDAPMEEVATPGVKTIAELTSFLNKSPQSMIKSLLYLVDDKPVLALLRGDRELNEAKLGRVFGAVQVEPADPDTAQSVIGAPVGFLGPIGLEGVTIVADPEVVLIEDGITGGNKADSHYIHVVYGRDYKADRIEDLRTMTRDDVCPECGHAIEIQRAIELGHVFQLGTKYSEALNARFLDEEGREKPMVMGCYGIGVSRTMAAVIEQHHDEDGIIWPMNVAPFHVHIIVINPKQQAQMNAATTLYEALWDLGVETVLDDRDERPGVKFNDSDLIGFPLRVIVGPRSLASQTVEIRDRRNRSDTLISLDEAAPHIRRHVDAQLQAIAVS